MIRLQPILVILTVLLGSAGAGWSANLEKGADAYNKGDFAAAFLEFRPLAEQGHTAAQRQVELLRK